MDNIYSLITPIAVGLLLLEIFIAIAFKKEVYSFTDAMVNLGSGMINQCMNMFVLWLVIVSYGSLYENFAMFTWEKTFWYYFLLLTAIDFLFYWYHRFNHEVNFLWAAHSPHHQSEEFNFSVASRASVTQRLFSFTFYWPLVLIGFEPMDLYMMTGIHLIIGFTHHTRLIPKLWKPIEYIFNTPSHHRVHHGTNEKYLDKNYAEVFIIWDRMFGTFQEEDEKDPVRYGILRHPKSNSMFAVNFHFWWLLFKDFFETKSWKNKITLWFKPLGWRPSDVSYREPVKAIPYGEPKVFDKKRHKNSELYLIVCGFIGFFLMYTIISSKFNVPANYKFIFSMVLLYFVESWKFVMDRTKKFLLHTILSNILVIATFLEIADMNNVFTQEMGKWSAGIVAINLVIFVSKKVLSGSTNPSVELNID